MQPSIAERIAQEVDRANAEGGLPLVVRYDRAVLLPGTIERVARAMAEAANGGSWDRDFTSRQKELWRRRVTIAMTVCPE